jgi:hypothetical protein
VQVAQAVVEQAVQAVVATAVLDQVPHKMPQQAARDLATAVPVLLTLVMQVPAAEVAAILVVVEVAATQVGWAEVAAVVMWVVQVSPTAPLWQAVVPHQATVLTLTEAHPATVDL